MPCLVEPGLGEAYLDAASAGGRERAREVDLELAHLARGRARRDGGDASRRRELVRVSSAEHAAAGRGGEVERIEDPRGVALAAGGGEDEGDRGDEERPCHHSAFSP